MRGAGKTPGATEAELASAQKSLEEMLAKRGLSSALLMEVGEDAGARPMINLLDPNVVSTRGLDSIPMPSEIKIKDVVGRVRAKYGISEVRVNNAAADTDRFGFFSSRVPVEKAGTRVEIVAVD